MFTAVAMAVVNETEVVEIRKDTDELVAVLINQREVDFTSTQRELRGESSPLSNNFKSLILFKFILVIMRFIVVVVSFVAIFVSAFPSETFLCLFENSF